MSYLPIVSQAGGAMVPAMVVTQGANMLDRIVQAYTVKQQCRVAIRQLEVEERRITEEYKMHQARIHAEATIRLTELREQRRQFELQVALANTELRNGWVERSRLLDRLEQAQNDGRYESVTMFLQIFSELCAAQHRTVNQLTLSEANERKRIGG
jgi:hypothetical protein